MPYEAKTKPTEISVLEFLKANTEGLKYQDCLDLVELMEKLTGKKAKMWGPSIVGFGKYHYKYATGHEGDMAAVGFSPRKTNLTLYIVTGFGYLMDKNSGAQDLMAKLGKYKKGKACLYFKKLSDLNIDILTEIIVQSLDYLKKNYQTDLT